LRFSVFSFIRKIYRAGQARRNLTAWSRPLAFKISFPPAPGGLPILPVSASP
jgi:hypothetical protein